MAPPNRNLKFNYNKQNDLPILPLKSTLFISCQIHLTKPVTHARNLRVSLILLSTGYRILLNLPAVGACPPLCPRVPRACPAQAHCCLGLSPPDPGLLESTDVLISLVTVHSIVSRTEQIQ